MHVLKDLPKKHNQVVYCELRPEQRAIYDEIIQKQCDQITARARGEIPPRDDYNVLMQLRKAASHPLLFRRIYDDGRIKKMSKDIMAEEKYSTPEHSREAIFEDMSYMWDFTLHKLCLEHPSIQKHALANEEWMQAGKIDMLKKLLPGHKARGDKVLLFSFFTMVLDILEKVLDTMGIQYMRLDGQTKVDERQDMIDQFHEEEDVTVFLLSTKAGVFLDKVFSDDRWVWYQLGLRQRCHYIRREFQPSRRQTSGRPSPSSRTNARRDSNPTGRERHDRRTYFAFGQYKIGVGSGNVGSQGRR